MNAEQGLSPSSYDDYIAENDRANCARIEIRNMLDGDLDAKQHIAKGLIIEGVSQKASYKCPVSICAAIVNFSSEDGEIRRDGSCAVFMDTLRQQQ
jgi:hypothetical protein